IELLETDVGLAIEDLRIGGAAASSKIWNQIIADVLGKKVVSLTQSHTEVLGAAVLAGVSLGAYTDFESAMTQTVTLGDTFEPDDMAHESYNRLFPMYRELYEENKHHFKKLVELDLPQGWVTKGART
ncbi:MAG: hypothetical protein KJO32_16300, partial [Deltaproteobacteria bacterium]|nr:hypothetical protein [Deltaproteobacteria bacterium]